MDKWGIGRGEYEHCEDDDGYEWLWALCEVGGCPNNVCARMNDRFCWPHLMSGGAPLTLEQWSDEEVLAGIHTPLVKSVMEGK